MKPSRQLAPIFLAVALAAPAPAPAQPPLAPTASVQSAFTPGDRADDMIIETIAGARKQVLVQAFSFTHRRIAEALIKARSRGVEVVVIADYEQTHVIETSVIRDIAEAGVPVLLDAEHASAHNKIMIIDAGAPASSEQGSRLRDANVRESGAALSSAGVASVSGVTSPKGAPVPPSDGAADCAVITGSYNFTHAAQYRNAENALILKGNPPLCAAYRRNWNQHKTHSQPYARQTIQN